jgi:hypothetical protein
MLRSFIAATALVFALTASSHAENPTAGKLHGSWKRDAGGDVSITFHFKHDTLQVELKKDDGAVTLEAEYAVTSKGVLIGLVTKVDGNGPQVGDGFRFTFAVNGDTLTIKDLGGKADDQAKNVVEGDYKKVAK